MPESGEQIRALSVGSDIKGYRVESLLSQTELGLTYLARDLAQDLVVSIQEYFPTDFANREANGGVSDLGKSGESSFQWGLERFVAKASQLIGIKHPSISRVIQVLQAKGTAYAVMEHSDGETLAQRLEAQGTLSEEELKAIAIPLIAGLRLLHGADLVHRDVRPENIILTEDGAPVLTGFAITPTELVERRQTAQAMMASGYAALELHSAKENKGPAADIYSLGAILYRGVTGAPPPASLERAMGDSMSPAVDAGKGNARQPFLDAIDMALSIRAEDRPMNMNDFLTLLERVDADDPKDAPDVAKNKSRSKQNFLGNLIKGASRGGKKARGPGLMAWIGQTIGHVVRASGRAVRHVVLSGFGIPALVKGVVGGLSSKGVPETKSNSVATQRSGGPSGGSGVSGGNRAKAKLDGMQNMAEQNRQRNRLAQAGGGNEKIVRRVMGAFKPSKRGQKKKEVLSPKKSFMRLAGIITAIAGALMTFLMVDFGGDSAGLPGKEKKSSVTLVFKKNAPDKVAAVRRQVSRVRRNVAGVPQKDALADGEQGPKAGQGGLKKDGVKTDGLGEGATDLKSDKPSDKVAEALSLKKVVSAVSSFWGGDKKIAIVPPAEAAKAKLESEQLRSRKDRARVLRNKKKKGGGQVRILEGTAFVPPSSSTSSSTSTSSSSTSASAPAPASSASGGSSAFTAVSAALQPAPAPAPKAAPQQAAAPMQAASGQQGVANQAAPVPVASGQQVAPQQAVPQQGVAEAGIAQQGAPQQPGAAQVTAPTLPQVASGQPIAPQTQPQQAVPQQSGAEARAVQQPAPQQQGAVYQAAPPTPPQVASGQAVPVPVASGQGAPQRVASGQGVVGPGVTVPAPQQGVVLQPASQQSIVSQQAAAQQTASQQATSIENASLSTAPPTGHDAPPSAPPSTTVPMADSTPIQQAAAQPASQAASQATSQAAPQLMATGQATSQQVVALSPEQMAPGQVSPGQVSQETIHIKTESDGTAPASTLRAPLKAAPPPLVNSSSETGVTISLFSALPDPGGIVAKDKAPMVPPGTQDQHVSQHSSVSSGVSSEISNATQQGPSPMAANVARNLTEAGAVVRAATPPAADTTNVATLQDKPQSAGDDAEPDPDSVTRHQGRDKAPWERIFDMPGFKTEALAVLPDGGILTAGRNNSGSWLLHINATGDKVWGRAFDGHKADVLKSLAILPDGGLAVAGGQYLPIRKNTNGDAWVMRLKTIGKTVRGNTVGLYTRAHSMIALENGDLVVAGAINAQALYAANTSGPSTGADAEAGEIVLLKEGGFEVAGYTFNSQSTHQP